VIVALLVGTVQLLHVAISLLGLQDGVWSWVVGLDFQTLGYGMAALFLSTWLVSLLLWRALRIEQRWAPKVATGGAATVATNQGAALGDGM
jgi:high-affinity nickel-transport protein